jgi:hypothetical protein
MAAVALLPPGAGQAAFVLAGLGVEVIGLGFLFRAHRIPPEEQR